MTEAQVGLARGLDCLELAELSRVAIEYDLRWRWKPSKILELIKNQEASVIIARSKSRAKYQELMGFAAMEFYDTHAHLILLATAVNYRRQGVATVLLEWLEKSATIAGMAHISLEVRQENRGAVQFYEQHGYKIETLKQGYYDGKEDAYRMRRDLIDKKFADRRP